MSLAYYISLQNKNPGFDTFVNGKSLARACDQLDAIAKQLGVTPIGEFFGKKWHAAEAGLASVEALVRHLQEEPAAIPDCADVVKDLEEWQEVLRHAKAANIKWKMKIDY
jgi:hypothetical protein